MDKIGGWIQSCGIYVDIYENCYCAMDKTTCRTIGSSSSDPSWKLSIGFVMMRWKMTCGCQS